MLVCNSCFKFKQLTVVISIFFKLRLANQKLRFGFVKTNKIFESKLTSNSFNKFKMFFVLISCKLFTVSSLKNTNFCFFKYKAVVIANLFSFLLTFLFTILGFGPKITPPPTNNGERVEPARALPVPFCFQGLRPPPRT